MCGASGPSGGGAETGAAPAGLGGGADSGGGGGGAGGGAGAASSFVLQALQTGLRFYGSHQNYKAEQYVNEVRSQVIKDNAALSLKVANQSSADAEASDRTAEGVDTLVAKVNALRTRSALKTAQGEAGGSGITQQDVAGDAERIALAREGILAWNYKSRRQERLNQRRTISAGYINNLAGANTPYLPNPANLGATGLEIGAAGLQTYMDTQEANRAGAARAQGTA